MKARVASKYNKRVQQMQIALLDKPSCITIWATGACNFRCNYCIQSQTREVKEAEKFPIDRMLSWEMFLKIMEQVREFGTPVPAITFCGIGEPLLNPKLPEMVAYIKENKIASYVQIVTNGVLLTEEKSLALISAGLDFLSVSIQGVTAERYEEVCGVRVEIEELQKRLQFFAEHKGNCHLHVKTVDTALHGKLEHMHFAYLFGDIADSIFVDHVFPLFKNVDYAPLIREVRDQYTGEVLKGGEAFPCSMLFHELFVQPNGVIVPCCTSPVPVTYGTIEITTLKQAWNSKERRSLLLEHLFGNRKKYAACENCVQPEILNTEQGLQAMHLDKVIKELLVADPDVGVSS